MYLVYTFIFGALFLLCVICILLLRNYSNNRTPDRKAVPISIFYGISTALADMTERFKPAPLNNTLYFHRVRIISYILLSFIICCFMGTTYTISVQLDDVSLISSLSRPAAGEGDSTLTIIADSDSYTGPIDITIEERQYSFEEAIDIFNKYRKELDNYVLGDNTSFLKITSPIKMPSTIGSEDISISWHIANTDVIGYDGQLGENIPTDGLETDITATLTLGDISADLCYHVRVFPPKKDSKTILSEYINAKINSEDNATMQSITLPTQINGQAISYKEYKKPLPP